MSDFYDGYYEATDGDDVVVHLAYSEPEPSLLRVASKKGSSRPQLKVPGKIKRPGFRSSASSRSLKSRFEGDQSLYSEGDKSYPLLQDARDDMYESQLERVNIQDQRYSGSISIKTFREGGKSITSSLSSRSLKAIDLSDKASDTSFDLFATLLREYLTPKVKNHSYILDEDDIAYFDAILPCTLRNAFVDAVNIRMSRIESQPPEPNESLFQKNVREVYRLGLGKPKQDNFLLGGGQKLDGGGIKMYLIETEHRTNDEFVGDERDTDDITDADMSELIKSLDDLKDHELEWLKDSALPREQSYILEQAIASRKSPQSMQAKGNNEQLQRLRESSKSIREMSSNQSNEIHVMVEPIYPHKRGENKWKDGMLSIFAHGVFHPFLVLTWCAPIYAIAQVMTRLQLNWIGNPTSHESDTKEIYQKLNYVVMFWAMISLASLSWAIFSYNQTGFCNIASIFIFVMVNIFMHVFTAFIAGNTRIHLRELFNIADDYEEDYILSVFFLRFAIAQMGRYTGNYNKNQAYFWTATGLSHEWDLAQLETDFDNRKISSTSHIV